MGGGRAPLLQRGVDEAADDAVAVHDHTGDLGGKGIAVTAHGCCEHHLTDTYRTISLRARWKRRIIAIGLTIALVIFIIAADTLVLVGPEAAGRVARWVGAEPVVALMWTAIRWPVMIGCAVLAVDLIYHFAPNRGARWTWITPGAIVATPLSIAGSFGFKFHVVHFSTYTATYGAIGGVIEQAR